jgi:hypothetical protein
VTTERTRFDLTARRLARLDPVGFFIWLLTAFEEYLRFAGWLDPRSTPQGADPEVTGDTLARLEARDGVGAPWLFAVEFQTAPDPGMFGRLQKQIGEWWTDLRPDPLPDSRYQVCAAVVNLTGTSQSAPASRDYRFPTPDGLHWGGRVRERYLAEESADQTVSRVDGGELRRSILPLVPLMHGAGEPGIISRWLASAGQEQDPRRRADLGSLALTLAALKEWFGAWKDALKEWNMQESQFVLELQLATRLADVQAVLEERFGTIPVGLLERIAAVPDPGKLDQVLRAAARVSRLEDLPV